MTFDYDDFSITVRPSQKISRGIYQAEAMLYRKGSNQPIERFNGEGNTSIKAQDNAKRKAEYYMNNAYNNFE